MMKKYLIILSILLILVSTVSAQEPPKYNFGSMQPAKELSVSPGDSITTKLYFYNIYGNRITHISLSVSKAPEDWDISFDPPLHTTTVNISGIMTEVTENLFVEPSEALEEIPETIPEGIEYISSSVGYIGAKPVLITISVPEDEKLGKSFNITISASAEWLGQTGAVAIKQSRDFDFTVKVVPKEFKEEIVTTTIPETTTTIPVAKPIGITGYIIANYSLIGIIIALIIVIILLSYFSFFKGRKIAEEVYSYLFRSK